MLLDIPKIINRAIDDKEPDIWPLYGGGYIDRSQYITASEIGTCARKVKFGKIAGAASKVEKVVNGTAFKATTYNGANNWNFFERGHNVEDWFIKLLHLGRPEFPIVMTGENQKSFVMDNQSGTPDGVILPNGDDVGILEVKSVDPRTNFSRLPKRQHVDQVIQNLDLVSANMDRSPTGGLLVYIDCSNYKNIKSIPVEFSDGHAEKLETRANWIMEAQSPADLPAEGIFKDDCRYCAFTSECSAIVANEKVGENYDKDEAIKFVRSIFIG